MEALGEGNGASQLERAELRPMLTMLHEKESENNALLEQIQRLEENALQAQRTFHANQRDIAAALQSAEQSRLQSEEAHRQASAKTSEAAEAAHTSRQASLELAQLQRELELKQRSIDEAQRDFNEQVARHAQDSSAAQQALEASETALAAARMQLGESQRVQQAREYDARRAQSDAEAARAAQAQAQAALQSREEAASKWQASYEQAREMQAAAQREVEALKRQLSASNAALEQQRAGAARSGANSLRVEMAQRTERHATELGDLAGALLELRAEAAAQQAAYRARAQEATNLIKRIRRAAQSCGAPADEWRAVLSETLGSSAAQSARLARSEQRSRDEATRCLREFENERSKRLMLEERVSVLGHELDQTQRELHRVLAQKDREVKLLQKRVRTVEQQRNEAQQQYHESAAWSGRASHTPSAPSYATTVPPGSSFSFSHHGYGGANAAVTTSTPMHASNSGPFAHKTPYASDTREQFAGP